VEPTAELARVWELRGGVSASVTAFELRLPEGTVRKLLVRRYGALDVCAEPAIAEHEFSLLSALHAAGAKVPKPVFADGIGSLARTPLLVAEFVEGGPMPDPKSDPDTLAILAHALATIHQLSPLAGMSHLESVASRTALRLARKPRAVDNDFSKGLIRKELDRRWPPPQVNAPVLLHGDFWPGNTIWDEGRLVAVIDWEDAAVGDPLSDLGNVRCELAMSHGEWAAAEFTARYLACRPDVDAASLPHWDLAGALRPAGKAAGWGMAPRMLRRMQSTHRRFVEDAMQRLSR
jgi:aminoglycoside phosphotransferase (APT) family kinase protein